MVEGESSRNNCYPHLEILQDDQGVKQRMVFELPRPVGVLNEAFQTHPCNAGKIMFKYSLRSRMNYLRRPNILLRNEGVTPKYEAIMCCGSRETRFG